MTVIHNVPDGGKANPRLLKPYYAKVKPNPALPGYYIAVLMDGKGNVLIYDNTPLRTATVAIYNATKDLQVNEQKVYDDWLEAMMNPPKPKAKRKAKAKKET